jgi:hypothetical protein
LVRHSALARYLVFNLHALETLQQLPSLPASSRAQAVPRYAGYTATSLDSRRVAESYQGIDAFFRDLPRMTGLTSDRVLFILDGARHEDEIAGIESSYFGLMRHGFMERAARLGYDVIDLQPLLVAHSKATGQRMDFASDGHWNGTAHRVIADAVRASAIYRRVFASCQARHGQEPCEAAAAATDAGQRRLLTENAPAADRDSYQAKR